MFVNLQLTTAGVTRFEQQIEIEGRSQHFTNHTQVYKNITVSLEELDRIDNHFYVDDSYLMGYKEKNKRSVGLNNNASIESYIDTYIHHNLQLTGRALNYIPK